MNHQHVTTDRTRIVGGSRSEQGYWKLTSGPGEPHLVRSELLGPVSGAGQSSPGSPLLTIGHLADLHVCDSQSPARAEFLDRYADDDAPTKQDVPYVGSYRAQDCMTVQVAEAMVRSINSVSAGPIGGAPLDWAITTGDVVDNAQANEVGWYLGLLEGGRVAPDSGSPEHYEGVNDNEFWDESYWHPEPLPGRADRPHRLHGFPDAPGLLEAIRAPFDASGLSIPWLAVHGNHDQMIQGTIPALGPFADAGAESRKAIGLPEDWSTDAIVRFCRDVDSCQLDALALWELMRFRPITPDPKRRVLARNEFIAAHFGPRSRPAGHGFSASAMNTGRAYYRFDHAQVTVLVLDTVNEFGGWQGSLDPDQLAWLEQELVEADRERRYVVLASHHPLATLTNSAVADPGDRRVLADELSLVLKGHPSLVLWLNGHTHCHTVTAHADPSGSSWWEVTAASLVDFPQQGRIVELLRSESGLLTVAATGIDHVGAAPWSGGVSSVVEIAGLSRELAANDWQWRADDLAKHSRVGAPADRNVLLQLADPFPS
jgi:metallophosphoesterase (TIGR03767 family)